jgi:hypothetical protein
MYNNENINININEAEALYDKLQSITRKLKWEINKLKEQSFSLALKEESGKCVKDAYLTLLDKTKKELNDSLSKIRFVDKDVYLFVDWFMSKYCGVSIREGAVPDGTQFIFYDYIDLEIQNFNSIISEIRDNVLNDLFSLHHLDKEEGKIITEPWELKYITERSMKVFKELCFKHNVSDSSRCLTYAMCKNELDECFDFMKLLKELWR